MNKPITKLVVFFLLMIVGECSLFGAGSTVISLDNEGAQKTEKLCVQQEQAKMGATINRIIYSLLQISCSNNYPVREDSDNE
jgi:hypothetical protein